MARWLQARHSRVKPDGATAAEPNGVAADATRVERPRSRRAAQRNVPGAERVGSTVGGGALLAYGVRRRDPLGAAIALLGLAFVSRGITGRCSVYRAFDIDRTADRNATVEKQHGDAAVLDASHSVRVEHSVVVDRPLEELWRYWRSLENLPSIMRHLQAVTDHGDGRSSWVARGPAGTRVEWDATIINEVENQLLAWKSLDGADVPNAGSVHFTPADEGTEIRVVLEYDPPAGRLGTMVASLFGENPEQQVRDDLDAFRAAMEEGEAEATTTDREVKVPSGRESGGVHASEGDDDRLPAASADDLGEADQRG